MQQENTNFWTCFYVCPARYLWFTRILFFFLAVIVDLMHCQTMSSMPMKTFCCYVLVTIICFSLMGSCPGGDCLAQRDNVDKTSASHRVNAHAASEHFHVQSVHESHQIDLPQQCCRTSSKVVSDCVSIFVLPNKARTFRTSMIATSSVQMMINRFQFLARNFVSEIFNTLSPTLVSLRTVILLE
jgi:hypothetical protein